MTPANKFGLQAAAATATGPKFAEVCVGAVVRGRLAQQVLGDIYCTALHSISVVLSCEQTNDCKLYRTMCLRATLQQK